MRDFPALIFSVGFIFPFSICSGSCNLPSAWLGSWFESGHSFPVEITSTTLAHKGECMQKGKVEGQIIFKDSIDGADCLRCLYIHQKHLNIIQYKESHCIARRVSPVTNICHFIEVDDPLKTLFRISAPPAPCPISGSYSFSYQLGPGRNCSSPLSSMVQCTDQNTFLMKYQACPDMKGSESLTEQVECIGQWKEGSIRYFAARVKSSITNRPGEWEAMLRCYVYRPQYNGWLLAQSGEAKCNLHKATEGYRTMSLLTAEAEYCKFPAWLQPGKMFQNSLANISVTVRMADLVIVKEGVENIVECARIVEQTPDTILARVRILQGCNHLHQCVSVRMIEEEGMAVSMGGEGHDCGAKLQEEFLLSPLPSTCSTPGSCSPLAMATVNTATTCSNNMILVTSMMVITCRIILLLSSS